jgi:hypothetical protein
MKADLLQKYMSGLSDGKMCAEAKKQAAAKRSKAAQLKSTDDFSKVCFKCCAHNLPARTKRLFMHVIVV